MKVTVFIRETSAQNNITDQAHVYFRYFRVRDSKTDIKAVSELSINPNHWSAERQGYKKVKDPNLVASLSGHTDGSRAFARYREIDNEMKRELVKLID